MATLDQLHDRLTQGQFARIEDCYQTCLDALDFGLFEQILAVIIPLTDGERAQDKLAWQIRGLALRGLQDSAGAHQAFACAARLAPRDKLIAHSLARSAFEAGYPAVELFGEARALAPSDAGILLGEAAAMLAQGQGAEACRALAETLEANPGWFEGHKAYARISAMALPEADRQASLRSALVKYPQDPSLWHCLIEAAMQADDYALAHQFVGEARTAIGETPELERAEAICRNETGDPAGAMALFQRLAPPANAAALAHVLRCLIRLGRFDEASARADQSFPGDQDLALWPYRALIWRAAGDPRWHWLEGDERLIGSYDLTGSLGSLDDLADVLRAIHTGTGQPIDQSVRGGTQTDGNLLARAEPEIRRLRAAVLEAVRAHVAQLPDPVAGHPTLLARRDPVRIQGAWSVRLLSQGFHVDHVHPQGWLSSAFYAALPEGEQGIARQGKAQHGWLTFGECLSLLPDFPAFRTIEPKRGHLALFPSTLWHGTRPFDAGERMTVALDIERPRQ
ncbi:putative 2OG-Fe(II) oxygenase [Novosphingobium sp.]|uniref:putative 2OG-Fe(II) oxygenase n=1 Tax=Novosphingobium sp. TaxID=1874826 RepID=UPI0025E76BE5|nr:putative 2OG-Fe(II) oxygenase [Novosphingobium sp.]MCC6927228.1 hypothetical protein [Novosphingobium sp.]